MSDTVSTKVDLVVTQAVTRALQQFVSMNPSSGPTTPVRKRVRHKDKSGNVTMTDGDKNE
jgi:hypothetical protein